MPVSPNQYAVSLEEMRQRFKLNGDDIVFDYGYEKRMSSYELYALKQTYTMPTLFIRTRPDFLMMKNRTWFFVEAKQRDDTVEAIQLYFNKMTHAMGVPVIYSFPEYYVPCTAIELDTILIPPKYADDFHFHLESEIKNKFSLCEFEKIPYSNGSGDPFVKLDKEWLKEFSETFVI